MNAQHAIQDLPATTFGSADVGRDYLTALGYRVTVIEVVPGSHAIVQTKKGKEMRTKGDAAAYGPCPDEAPVPEPERRPEPAARAPRARDARLPEPGTPIARSWRGHQVVATEQDDGTFRLEFDGEPAGTGRSLTRVAELALAREGITSGVNGFVWFKVGTPAGGAHPRAVAKPEALRARVARLEAAHARAYDLAVKLEGDLEAARAALAAVDA